MFRLLLDWLIRSSHGLKPGRLWAVNEKEKEFRTYTYFGGIIILDSLMSLATLHRLNYCGIVTSK
jgi:hypothetical protein